MSSNNRLKNNRDGKLNYQTLEPRKVLAAIFPAYVDGTFSLGDSSSAAPYPLADTFELETNPGATKTIYLDFDGHFSNNNRWNHSINFPAWNRDGNANSFSNAELIEIQRQFQNVAEDFAPFDVNVTTKDPGTAALIRSSFSDQNYGVRVINTQATNGFGNGIGGIAYLRSFDDNADNPVFVFNKGVNNGAMTITHEVGHAFGLSHDGLNNSSYHPGTGSGETSWGPLLGAPFNSNLTQWSNGDYAGSTTTQDDLAIITDSFNGINYKADDVGNTFSTASYLETNGNNVFDWGIVERSTDVDFYKFNTSGGLVDLQVNAFAENPNLDIRLRLYSSNGTQLLSNNPADGVDALIQRNLAGGTYYLAIDGVGKSGAYSDYGSLGFYSIEGTIPTQSLGQKIGEVGDVTDLNHLWQTVQLSQSYQHPVVVAGIPTTKGREPVTIRIRNVTSNSFQMRIQEWNYSDGTHGRERVSYMVVEAGTHQLTDGTVIRASKINSQDHNWTNRTFAGAFTNSAETPVIVASVTTTRDVSAVTTRIKGVSKTGFELRIQEEQAADQVHTGEEISWIAIEKGDGETGALDLIVGDTGRTVNHSDHQINFTPTFSSKPALFAELQTSNGNDNTTVRTRGVVSNQALVFLEEERSADAEITHATERVGYFAIELGDILAVPTSSALSARSITAPTTPTASATSVTASRSASASAVSASALPTGRMIDGDLSAALDQMQSWGELFLDLGHTEDGDHDHDHDLVFDHDHDNVDHECDCECNCNCNCGRSDFHSAHFRADFSQAQSVRELARGVRTFFGADFSQEVSHLADSIRSEFNEFEDQSRHRFRDFYEATEENPQETGALVSNHIDSLLDENLDLFSNWF